jgi:sugar phosphate isomerase/epimerase
VRLDEIVAALRQVGYAGYVVLETGTFGDPASSVRAGLERLRAAVGQ